VTKREWTSAAGPALLAGAAAAGSSAVLLARGRIPFTSDQIVVYLMAMDILKGIERPVFYYGVAYAGTLEAHLLAVVGALLGPSRLSYYLFTTSLLALLVAVVYVTTRRAFGPKAAAAAGVWLAIGPYYFFRKGLTSDGAYLSVTLLLAIALAGLLALAEASDRTRIRWSAVTGFVAGLAWWVMPIAAAFVAPLFVVGARDRFRLLRSPKLMAALGSGFFLGSAPWWIWNATHGWESLRAPEMAGATEWDLARNVADVFREALPNLLGATWPWHTDETFPGARLVCAGVGVALVAFGIWRSRRDPTDSRRLAFAVFVSFLVLLFALSLAIRRTDFRDPRYVFPAYLALAPLVGAAFDALARWRPAAAAAMGGLLAINLLSQLFAPNVKDRERGLPHDPYRQVGWLESKGARRLYGSYWAAYKLYFFSGGGVVATPFGTGDDRITRIPRLRKVVDSEPSPTFLFEGSEKLRFRRFLTRAGASHRSDSLYGYTLYSSVDPEAVRLMRYCNCIPVLPLPGEIRWIGLEAPAAAKPNERIRLTATFQNLEPFDIYDNVGLGMRWRRLDGTEASADAGRVKFAVAVKPGEIRTTPLEVYAPAEGGTYDLVVDLVDEWVIWFERRGIRPLVQRIIVTP